MYSGADQDEAGKIVTDPFGTDLTGWNDYEKLIDAREFYRLTLLLIDKTNGVLVGYRDLYLGSDDIRDSKADEGANGWWDGSAVVKDSKYGAKAVVTFNYDHPMHKCGDGSSLESLNRGMYRMIALANWGPVTINATDKSGKEYVKEYKGLTDRSGKKIQDYVDDILLTYNGIKSTSAALKFSGSDSQYDSYHGFMDFAMYSSDTDFLCTLAPQPLFLIQDFELRPGQNNISGQLKRTWARLRIAIENVSHDDLTVEELSFSDHTTRNQSYLFLESGRDASALDPDKEGQTTKYGAPNIFKTNDNAETDPYNALIATVNGTVISGLPYNKSENENINQRVIFDGYILDGDGDGNPFTYDLTLRYKDKTIIRLRRAKNGEEWAVNKSDPYSIGDGLLYVIQNQETHKHILYAGKDQLETELLSGYIDDHYNFKDTQIYFDPVQVFRLCAVKENDKIKTETITNSRTNQEESYPLYNIQTYDKLYWVGTPKGDFKQNIPLLPISADPVPYVIRNDGTRKDHLDQTYLSFYSTQQSGGQRLFINVNGKSDFQNQVDGWKDNDGGSQFYLHRVDEVKEDAAFSKKITLTTIDPETAVSSPVTAIHRNDFINILISVSYNEKSGEIEFKVKDWETGGGDIEFN